MTLGAVLLLLPSLERWRGRLAQEVAVFGRVPLFFYRLHLPVIHLVTLVGARLASHTWVAGYGEPRFPPSFEPSLLRVYLVWLLLVLAMYPV